MFKLGDKIVNTSSGIRWTLNGIWLVEIANEHKEVYEKVLKNNKLNRKLYPNHKIKDEYLLIKYID